MQTKANIQIKLFHKSFLSKKQPLIRNKMTNQIMCINFAFTVGKTFLNRL